MLLLIITCRYIIGEKQQILDKVKNLPFGKYLYNFINWYTKI